MWPFTVSVTELGDKCKAPCPALITGLWYAICCASARIWKALLCHHHSGGSKINVQWKRGQPRWGQHHRALPERYRCSWVTQALVSCPNHNPILAPVQTSPLLWPKGTFVVDPESDIQHESLTRGFIKALNGPISLLNFVVCLTCSTCGCTVCKLCSLLKIQAIGVSFHTRRGGGGTLTTFKIKIKWEKQETEVFDDSIQYCSEKKITNNARFLAWDGCLGSRAHKNWGPGSCLAQAPPGPHFGAGRSPRGGRARRQPAGGGRALPAPGPAGPAPLRSAPLRPPTAGQEKRPPGRCRSGECLFHMLFA